MPRPSFNPTPHNIAAFNAAVEERDRYRERPATEKMDHHGKWALFFVGACLSEPGEYADHAMRKHVRKAVRYARRALKEG